MRLTSKGRYAVRAMLDLTFHSSGNPVRLQEISTRQSISLHYLEQLFRKLRTGRVVKSVRGPGGGYVLARSMDEITVRDVLECVGENINPARDISGNPSSGVEVKAAEGESVKVETTEFNLTKGFFENLGILMQEYLTTTTLGDLKRKAATTTASNTINTSSDMNSSMNTTGTNSISSDMGSIIRPNIGEINQ
ncbi:MAG: Rrf2 family transcriptional regulator [Bacteriovoracaceae bacterium]|jgi:Rrf2 family iron-sulfur cluster assembly transcriptional regulator|nr:Rrf2 family transcriptional regulator [Bacteriovoracaceae bacterium]